MLSQQSRAGRECVHVVRLHACCCEQAAKTTTQEGAIMHNCENTNSTKYAQTKQRNWASGVTPAACETARPARALLKQGWAALQQPQLCLQACPLPLLPLHIQAVEVTLC